MKGSLFLSGAPVDAKFQHSRTGNFAQESPTLKNPYDNDGLLQSFLKKHIPKEVAWKEIENKSLIEYK